MELKQAIYERRSIRHYKDTPVPEALVQEILESACMAPSGVNRQPWFFLAIASPEARAKYMNFMAETATRFQGLLEARFSRNPEIITQTLQFLNTLGNAPVVVLAFLLKEEYTQSGSGQSERLGVAAGIQNLVLTATDKGLGSCWMTAPVEAEMAEEIRKTFAPDKGELVAAVALGYADEAPKAPKRREGRFEII